MGLVLLTIGAVVAIASFIAGRAHERGIWHQRLLRRTGLLGDRRMGDDFDPQARGISPSESERLAQALDAVAVEVERIGEAQRFLTKLLAEKERPKRGPNSISPLPGHMRSPLPPTS